MDPIEKKSNRRNFLKTTAALTGTVSGLTLLPFPAVPGELSYADRSNVLGPQAGFAPHVGSVYSMLSWMRMVVLGSVEGMTREQLDYIHDEKSNSIGSMLLHLAATEKYYQLHTFNNMKWGSWSDEIKKQWDLPMNLGDEGRKKIKGHDLAYYLDILKETRETTIQEFKKRDDEWMLAVDEGWFWGPTNNYCKWFHVCEHESNHNGQIKWIKSRIPV